MVDVVTKAPENYPTEARELAPDSPEKIAFGILEKYAENSGDKERKDLIEHAQRVLGYVKQYAGDIMPDCSSVVYLHDVVSRFLNTNGKYKPETEEKALEALMGYFTNPDIPADRAQFERNVLADFEQVENAARKYRADFAEKVAEEMVGKLQASGFDKGDSWLEVIKNGVDEMISQNYMGEIPGEVWRTSIPELELKGVAEKLCKINIESVIIKACELLDNLRNPASKRESAMLQDVLEAESFYVPILEALGFEALAATLMSEVKLIRLQKTEGEKAAEKINSVREKLNPIREIGPEKLLEDIFGGNDDSRLEVKRVVERENSYLKDSDKAPSSVDVVDFDYSNGTSAKGKARIKSDGSAAAKLKQGAYEGELPMDLFGAMVISEDLQESAQNFAKIVSDLRQRSNEFSVGEEAPSVELKNAPSKTHAIYVQGSQNYINAMKIALEKAGIDTENEVQFKFQNESEDGYKKMEVSKVTFLMTYDLESAGEFTEVPVEIQFLTGQERKRSRIGDVAHLIYKTVDTPLKHELDKLKKQLENKELSEAEYFELKEKACQIAAANRAEAPEILKSIHRRKAKLTREDFSVNPESDAGGDELFEKMMDYLERAA